MDKILLLQSIPGFGLGKTKKFIYDNINFITDDDYFSYLVNAETGHPASVYMDSVKKIKENCHRLGVEIIPCKFTNIFNSPLILYVKGDKGLLENSRLFAVVGTRNPSKQGQDICKKVVSRAVEQNIVIVSGLAKGCDTIAHKTTVELGGKTVAVLPMGHNINTATWIVDNGLIISEYPPFTNVKKYRCVNRNRIITGISKGVFVVESKAGGGSEHSIKYAFNMGVPIAYGIGFKGIKKYNAQQINNSREFDLFLEKCII